MGTYSIWVLATPPSCLCMPCVQLSYLGTIIHCAQDLAQGRRVCGKCYHVLLDRFKAVMFVYFSCCMHIPLDYQISDKLCEQGILVRCCRQDAAAQHMRGWVKTCQRISTFRSSTASGRHPPLIKRMLGFSCNWSRMLKCLLRCRAVWNGMKCAIPVASVNDASSHHTIHSFCSI